MKKATQMLGVRLEAGLAERARRKAETEHRTLSDAIRKLIGDWLKKKAA